MAKEKEHKPRPDKYAQKVAINVGFNQVLQIFSQAAHGNVEKRVMQANEQHLLTAPASKKVLPKPKK